MQALVAQAAIEALDEGFVGRLSRPREVERDAVLVRPSIERLRDKLRPFAHRRAIHAEREPAASLAHTVSCLDVHDNLAPLPSLPDDIVGISSPCSIVAGVHTDLNEFDERSTTASAFPRSESCPTAKSPSRSFD